MIKFQEGIPIYLQIVRELKGRMLSGTLQGGDKLPSVRELAQEFQVNPNTVQRVFMELEREGLTYSERGIGTFVRDDPQVMADVRNASAQRLQADFVREMKALGCSKENTLAALVEIWDEGEKSNDQNR